MEPEDEIMSTTDLLSHPAHQAKVRELQGEIDKLKRKFENVSEDWIRACNRAAELEKLLETERGINQQPTIDVREDPQVISDFLDLAIGRCWEVVIRGAR